jgi:hypothetical protein
MDENENNNETDNRNGQVHVPVTRGQHLWELANNVMFTGSLWLLHNSALMRSVVYMGGTLQVRERNGQPRDLVANGHQTCLSVHWGDFGGTDIYYPIIPIYDPHKYQQALSTAASAINFNRDITYGAMLFFTGSFLLRKLVFKRVYADVCVSLLFWITFYIGFSMAYQTNFLNTVQNAFCDMYNSTNITGLDAGVDPLTPVYEQLSLSGILTPMFPIISESKMSDEGKVGENFFINMMIPTLYNIFMVCSYLCVNCSMEGGETCSPDGSLQRGYSNFVLRDVFKKFWTSMQSRAGNVYRNVTGTNQGLLFYNERRSYGSVESHYREENAGNNKKFNHK